MTTILNNPSMSTHQPVGGQAIVFRAKKLLWRAMIFLSIGSILTVLIAWALGLWADVESATVVTAAIPQRGRIWNISAWNSSGAQRLRFQRQVASWAGWQATGAPDTPMSGDCSLAWCPATADGQAEWLILDYPTPVVPKELHIYENYAPGAVNRVTIFKENGEEIEAWRGQDPTPATSTAGISKISVNLPFKTLRVKIYIDSKNVVGWNEIDAVGLLDETGSIQWASDVQDSSSYANAMAATSGSLSAPAFNEIVPRWCPVLEPSLTPQKNPRDADEVDERTFEARGWPMLALWTERSTVTPGTSNSLSVLRSGFAGGMISLPAAGTLPPVLPSRPIWSGLIVNSIFYGAFLAVAYWLLTKPRRLILELRRMRSGCCIACGYELDFDFRGGCPECGWRRSPR